MLSSADNLEAPSTGDSQTLREWGEFDVTDYVFGYGSLLERESRTRTNPEALGAWPARVTGYQRGWFHRFGDSVGSTWTYLGAEPANGQTINGVVYAVKDIEATKQRETGYTAVRRTADEFAMLDGSGPLKVGGDVNVSIFVSNPESISKTRAPTPTCPMVQSYVDICSTDAWNWSRCIAR